MIKMNDKAQGHMMLYFLIMMFMVFFVFSNPWIQAAIVTFGNSVFYPIIGFDGKHPILTIFFAGLIVVTLSSILTNFFTNWKKMGEAQEIQRAFQKELQDARKKGNENRVKKLMKMQPEIMKRQTEASSGMLKPMIFLMIFIFPIFMWLRAFLAGLPYYYFTVPWANTVSLFSKPFLWQAWLWIYLICSIVFGQLIRQGLKWISWSDWWQNIRGKRTISPR